MKYPLLSPIIKNLLYCLLFVVMGGCSFVNSVVKRTAPDFLVWTVDLRSDYQKNSYHFVLKSPINSVSGICFLKKNGGEWRGTLINEMGAKIFDFIVTDTKCELLDVISMMNKPYITKTVAGDLYFLFNADNPEAPFQKRLERFEQDGTKVVNYQKKQIVVKSDSILLINRRYKLQYELKKIVEMESDKVIM